MCVDLTAGFFRAFKSLTLLALSAFASACGGSDSDAPPPIINLSTTSIQAAAKGENISVEVSNGGGGTLRWTAAVVGAVDWARIVSGGSGSNAGTIEIEIDANPSTEREFELTVSAGSVGSRSVSVRQADGRPAIEMMAGSTELDGEGGSVSIEVRNPGVAPMQWSASLPDELDWAYIRSGREGTDAGEILVRYNLNSGIDRELEVRVASAAAVNSPQSLTLSQEWFASSACTYPEARAEFLEQMKRWYYFNDEPEQQARYDGLVIEDYTNLDSLLGELRWQPQDWLFSRWATGSELDSVIGGQFFGFGFNGALLVDLLSVEWLYFEVADVYAGSPAHNANLERGDRIVGLNGWAVTDMDVDHPSSFYDELGPDEEGFEVSFEVEKPSGERRTVRMAKTRMDFPAVPEEHVQVFDTVAGKVGYLHVRGFWGAVDERLLEEFAKFKAGGVRNLIVDLRYNFGGSAAAGHGLATLIGGPELYENEVQSVLSRRIHNELLQSEGRDTTVYFGCDAYTTPDMVERCENRSSLRDLDTVVFITAPTTFATSEMVIAALQPHENVALVGTRTLGGPAGAYGLGFCLADTDDSSTRQAELWAAAFAIVNAEDWGGYWNGLRVTEGCQVADDDLSRSLGDPEETRLAAALRYLETGSCGAPAASQAEREPARVMLPRNPVRRHLGH